MVRQALVGCARIMRIGTDVRYLSHGLVGGVHQYVSQLMPALIRLAPEHDFVLYADRRRPFELTMLPLQVTVQVLPWHSSVSSIAKDPAMPRWMAFDHRNAVHFPSNQGLALLACRLWASEDVGRDGRGIRDARVSSG